MTVAEVLTTAEREIIRREAQRIAWARLKGFAITNEVRRTAARIKAPYRLLHAETVVAEYQRVRVLQDALEAGI